VGTKPCDIRALINERLTLFVDPRFESKDSPQKHTGAPMELMAELQ
jgi:hypothetical protein